MIRKQQKFPDTEIKHNFKTTFKKITLINEQYVQADML